MTGPSAGPSAGANGIVAVAPPFDGELVRYFSRAVMASRARGGTVPMRFARGARTHDGDDGRRGLFERKVFGMAAKIRMRMKAFDHDILDKWCQKVIDAARGTGARVAGPIPLPTQIEKYTVLRSPHTDKKSREQFEIRTHKRVIYITEFTRSTMDSITKVVPPRGVDIKIKQFSE